MTHDAQNEALDLASYLFNELGTGGGTMDCFDDETIDDALVAAREAGWIYGGDWSGYRITAKGAEHIGVEAGTIIKETRPHIRDAWAEAVFRGN